MNDTGSQPSIKQYAGDVTVQEAWDILAENPDAILVDVRTNAEWAYVGIPDLSEVGKKTHLVSWVSFPDMSPNPAFVSEIANLQSKKDAPVLMLCRSGVRSIAAAIAATNAGFSQSFNILEGFEGDRDMQGHRGTVGGWKKHLKDWVQN
jgi:rhodanese-related sulfurtransferase